jgi:hypothetical protein
MGGSQDYSPLTAQRLQIDVDGLSPSRRYGRVLKRSADATPHGTRLTMSRKSESTHGVGVNLSPMMREPSGRKRILPPKYIITVVAVTASAGLEMQQLHQHFAGPKMSPRSRTRICRPAMRTGISAARHDYERSYRMTVSRNKLKHTCSSTQAQAHKLKHTCTSEPHRRMALQWGQARPADLVRDSS